MTEHGFRIRVNFSELAKGQVKPEVTLESCDGAIPTVGQMAEAIITAADLMRLAQAEAKALTRTNAE